MEYLHSDRNKNHPWVIFNQFLHTRSPHDCDFTLQESNLGDVKEPGFPYILGNYLVFHICTNFPHSLRFGVGCGTN